MLCIPWLVSVYRGASNGTKSAEYWHASTGTKPVIRRHDILTELTVQSQLPPKARLWLCVTLLLSGMYLCRILMQTIPPEDHVAIALIICFLLTQFWFSIERTSIKISLPHNRCWLSYHRLGKSNELSLPVSQIHSAQLQFEEKPAHGTTPNARIALVTTLGMIPASQQYQGNPVQLHVNCEQINRFLESRMRFLEA